MNDYILITISIMLGATTVAMTMLTLFVWKRFRFYASQVWRAGNETKAIHEAIDRHLSIMWRTHGRSVREIREMLDRDRQQWHAVVQFGRPPKTP
jgi:hypothetical protein